MQKLLSIIFCTFFYGGMFVVAPIPQGVQNKITNFAPLNAPAKPMRSDRGRNAPFVVKMGNRNKNFQNVSTKAGPVRAKYTQGGGSGGIDLSSVERGFSKCTTIGISHGNKKVTVFDVQFFKLAEPEKDAKTIESMQKLAVEIAELEESYKQTQKQKEELAKLKNALIEYEEMLKKSNPTAHLKMIYMQNGKTFVQLGKQGKRTKIARVEFVEGAEEFKVYSGNSVRDPPPALLAKIEYKIPTTRFASTYHTRTAYINLCGKLLDDTKFYYDIMANKFSEKFYVE